jgi:hypothetical protein
VVAVAGVAALRGEVENGFNRMPGRCDRYEDRRCVASKILERKTLDALITILDSLRVVG